MSDQSYSPQVPEGYELLAGIMVPKALPGRKLVNIDDPGIHPLWRSGYEAGYAAAPAAEPGAAAPANGADVRKVLAGLDALAAEDRHRGATYDICTAAANLLRSGAPGRAAPEPPTLDDIGHTEAYLGGVSGPEQGAAGEREKAIDKAYETLRWFANRQWQLLLLPEQDLRVWVKRSQEALDAAHGLAAALRSAPPGSQT